MYCTISPILRSMTTRLMRISLLPSSTHLVCSSQLPWWPSPLKPSNSKITTSTILVWFSRRRSCLSSARSWFLWSGPSILFNYATFTQETSTTAMLMWPNTKLTTSWLTITMTWASVMPNSLRWCGSPSSMPTLFPLVLSSSSLDSASTIGWTSTTYSDDQVSRVTFQEILPWSASSFSISPFSGDFWENSSSTSRSETELKPLPSSSWSFPSSICSSLGKPS